MLHAVTLIYLCPEEDIARHLDAHKQWLVRGVKEGIVLSAGPLSNDAGGLILFHSDDVNLIRHFLKDDPFIQHKIVEADLVSFEPALSARDFPEQWAEKSRFI